ncbi:MAG: hypothetical protein ABIJ08_04115 [Nanoarchaeota archaeon]
MESQTTGAVAGLSIGMLILICLIVGFFLMLGVALAKYLIFKSTDGDGTIKKYIDWCMEKLGKALNVSDETKISNRPTAIDN